MREEIKPKAMLSVFVFIAKIFSCGKMKTETRKEVLYA